MSRWQLRATEIASSEIQRTYQETNLHLFAENGNVDEVNRCLAAGEMVDKRNTRRQTALHSACAGGHRDVADILLSQGADPAAKDDQLSSILHCAASGAAAKAWEGPRVENATTTKKDLTKNEESCSLFRPPILHPVDRILVAAGADTIAVDCRKRSPADVIGEMGYVKQDVSKAIKTIMNSASGGFREQAADLKREKEMLEAEVETTARRLHAAEGELENAEQEINQLKKKVKAMEDEISQLRQAARELVQRSKKKNASCTIM